MDLLMEWPWDLQCEVMGIDAASLKLGGKVSPLWKNVMEWVSWACMGW